MEELILNFLPEGCVSQILSLTTPRDVCRSSLASSTIRLAAESNVVWERFLPSDYQDILQRSVSPMAFSSLKELYFHLCSPIHINGGKMTFALEKSTGKIRFVLSARELSITWGDDPMYWTWKSVPESRFSEVAELRMTCWLEIHGKINTRILSPNTTYAAYLILQFANRAHGLDTMPSVVSTQIGNLQCRGSAYLCRHNNQKQPWKQVCHSLGVSGGERLPCVRKDGWLEIKLGEFFNFGGDGEVRMSLMEVKGHHIKGGLVIEGIEVRPRE